MALFDSKVSGRNRAIDFIAQQCSPAERDRLVAFVVEWELLRRQNHHLHVSVERYAERWERSVSTTYRTLSLFRDVTGYSDPGSLSTALYEGPSAPIGLLSLPMGKRTEERYWD